MNNDILAAASALCLLSKKDRGTAAKLGSSVARAIQAIGDDQILLSRACDSTAANCGAHPDVKRTHVREVLQNMGYSFERRGCGLYVSKD